MTSAKIQQILRDIGLRPQRAAGQNFLLDESVVNHMVQDAAVDKNDTVLEIGPGLGILTEALAASGAKIIAVELDRRLADYLQRHFAKQANVTIITGDIFRIDLTKILHDRAYKLVANLPYSATSLVLRNFLTLSPRPSRLTVMLQQEVADRIVAPPGKLSLLGLMAQYYSQPRQLGQVPPTSFWPAPAVTSAVIDCWPVFDREPNEAKALFHLAHAAFAARRKQLINGLASLPEFSKSSVEELLRSQHLDIHMRPQELTIEQWIKLAKTQL